MLQSSRNRNSINSCFFPFLHISFYRSELSTEKRSILVFVSDVLKSTRIEIRKKPLFVKKNVILSFRVFGLSNYRLLLHVMFSNSMLKTEYKLCY